MIKTIKNKITKNNKAKKYYYCNRCVDVKKSYGVKWVTLPNGRIALECRKCKSHDVVAQYM